MKLNKLREEMANTFIAALKEDQIPWEKQWRSSERPRNAVSDYSYKGINNIWLSYMAEKNGYQDPRWCTYKQAQEQGWNVRKGENGCKVEFWSLYDTQDKRKVTREEANKLQKQLTEEEFLKRVKPVSSVYTVFNAEQIDGIPELDQVKIPFSAEELISQRDVLLKNMSVDFHEGGDRAFYRPADDSITLPFVESFQDAYSYMATLLHEAGHATGHESRLDRPVRNTFGSPEYAKEELRAEIASAFTGQALGVDVMSRDHLDNHKAYIQSWIKTLEDNPGELYAAIRDAEKISEYLMEKGEFDLDAKMRDLEAKRAIFDGKEVLVSEQLAYRLADQGIGIFHTIHERDGREYTRQSSDLRSFHESGRSIGSHHVPPYAFENRENFFPTIECTLRENPAWKDDPLPDNVTRTYTVTEFDTMMRQGMGQEVDFTIQMENQRIKEVLPIGDGSEGLLDYLEKNGYRKEFIETLHREMDVQSEFSSYLERTEYGKGDYPTRHIDDGMMKVSGELAGRLVEDGIGVYVIPDKNIKAGQTLAERVADLKELSELSSEPLSAYVSQKAFENRESFFPTVECKHSEDSFLEEGTTYTVSEFDSIMKQGDLLQAENKLKLFQQYIQQYKDLDGAAREQILAEIKNSGCHKVDFTIQMENRRIEDQQDIGYGDGGLLDFLEKSGYQKAMIEDLQKEMNTHTEFISYQERLDDVLNSLDQPPGLAEQSLHLQDAGNTLNLQGIGREGSSPALRAGGKPKGVVPVGR